MYETSNKPHQVMHSLQLLCIGGAAATITAAVTPAAAVHVPHLRKEPIHAVAHSTPATCKQQRANTCSS
jgi:hypothetical protein